MSDDEIVKVSLGDDYYGGAYFMDPELGGGDYEVPRPQLERWQEARSAWVSAQEEIEEVMSAQAGRIRELRQSRMTPQDKAMAEILQGIFQGSIESALRVYPIPPKDTPATFHGPTVHVPKAEESG